MFRKSPGGVEHLFILDRIKEMIKVKVRSFVFFLGVMSPLAVNHGGWLTEGYMYHSRGCKSSPSTLSSPYATIRQWRTWL